MNKNKFFEKVGKLTFSIILTSILVVGFVGAATTWRELKGNEIVSGTHWQNMVAEIDSKISSVDLSDYYTKSEADTNFASITEAVNAVINTCKICIAHADYNLTPSNWVCKGINDGAANRKLSGGVGSDDTISVKLVCETGTWSSGVYVNSIDFCAPERWESAKSGSCTPGDTHKYYVGGTNGGCGSGKGGGDPWVKGQKQYIQTCN